MNKKGSKQFRESVVFRFLSEEESDDLAGTVILRDKEMVLEIPGGYGPYLIEGKKVGHHFEGVQNVRGSEIRVKAKWADLGGQYVGIWHESGTEYFFSFECRSAK